MRVTSKLPCNNQNCVYVDKQIAFQHDMSVGVFGNANMAPTLGTKQQHIIHS
jgi:hypothetical protein